MNAVLIGYTPAGLPGEWMESWSIRLPNGSETTVSRAASEPQALHGARALRDECRARLLSGSLSADEAYAVRTRLEAAMRTIARIEGAREEVASAPVELMRRAS